MQFLPEWAAALVLALVAVAAFLTIFAWRWAVRRPSGVSKDKGMAPGPDEGASAEHHFVYAAIGASDVVGTGTQNPTRDNWPTVLHGLMPEETMLQPFARPGITLREANAQEVFAAVRAQPQLVTLWNCVNDVAQRVPLDAYTRELEIALTRLTTETRADILVLNVPDLSILLPEHIPAAQRELIRRGIEQWNRAMARTVERYGKRVALLDLFFVSSEMMSNRDHVASDGFHLSTSGHVALAHLVLEAIESQFVIPGRKPQS